MEKKETTPSYKRRLNDWDYSQPRIYMLTMATEGRLPLFGVLTGDASQPTWADDAPRLQPSALGEAVLQEVDGIPRYYPQITIIARQLMPDHLHILLYVRQTLPVHLGQVVSGFKAGCNKKWRQMQGGQWGGAQREGAQRQETQRQSRWAPNQAPDQAPTQGLNQAPTQAPDRPYGGSVPSGSVARNARNAQAPQTAPKRGLLWEQGYHDRILSGEGQLQRLIDYIHDNPRRSLVKRQHADWFRLCDITAAGTTLHAIGNQQLLQAPHRQAVRISSRITEEQRYSQQQDLLAAARQGTVLISPFISTGERQVEERALEEGLPIVKLLPDGFSPYYKPQGLYFDACSDGRLLLLTPYPHSTQKVTLTRSICNYLNVLAARLVE